MFFYSIIIVTIGLSTTIFVFVKATFLPEVAKEQQWNQQQTIRQLVHKSGFRHDLTPEIQDTISCTRYQSSKHYLTYQEYVDLPDALSVVSP